MHNGLPKRLSSCRKKISSQHSRAGRRADEERQNGREGADPTDCLSFLTPIYDKSDAVTLLASVHVQLSVHTDVTSYGKLNIIYAFAT